MSEYQNRSRCDGQRPGGPRSKSKAQFRPLLSTACRSFLSARRIASGNSCAKHDTSEVCDRSGARQRSDHDGRLRRHGRAPQEGFIDSRCRASDARRRRFRRRQRRQHRRRDGDRENGHGHAAGRRSPGAVDGSAHAERKTGDSSRRRRQCRLQAASSRTVRHHGRHLLARDLRNPTAARRVACRSAKKTRRETN